MHGGHIQLHSGAMEQQAVGHDELFPESLPLTGPSALPTAQDAAPHQPTRYAGWDGWSRQIMSEIRLMCTVVLQFVVAPKASVSCRMITYSSPPEAFSFHLLGNERCTSHQHFVYRMFAALENIPHRHYSWLAFVINSIKFQKKI